MTRPTRLRWAALASVTVMTATGCAFSSEDIPLPFSDGSDDNAYSITVEMAQINNLVKNAEVMYNDVIVGSIKNIEFEDWRAILTLGINGEVELPGNIIAKSGQKSLLGAEFLDLSTPEGEQAAGDLRPGSTIPVQRTGAYPETEEVLSALSVVLNGGGLQQVRTITTELNNVFRGRTDDTRELLDNLDVLVSQLNGHSEGIVQALEGLEQLSTTLNDHTDQLDNALDHLPAGIAVLNENRPQLTRTLTALADLSDVGTSVLNSTRDDLLRNLRDLQPIVGQLANADTDLIESLSILLTFPFPGNTLDGAAKGDFANNFVTLDLRLSTLQENFLTGVPILGNLPPLGVGSSDSQPALQAPLGRPDQPDQSQAPAQSERPPSDGSVRTTEPPPPSDPVPGLLGAILGGDK
ncbi:phospholipid/cholesterol/gamma-HCH transport system substrate-binding protein [Amycolatopsis marina]|uniref:Phospholipid/cholesterol/gamma-HCH transport system substrate-binding protein n=1 Tax=Amycolatopsis marina TaxID=490629 RepID=A0A1I0YKQ1_9PSEU|nr:MCE family protein [Amycolatopsis marina]SFB13376.1 phospholipid/cholesterol/gamma-HCH transport system substrate-binding protein [Amycolatopsis marina]